MREQMTFLTGDNGFYVLSYLYSICYRFIIIHVICHADVI
jgi:hypothetical protein